MTSGAGYPEQENEPKPNPDTLHWISIGKRVLHRLDEGSDVRILLVDDVYGLLPTSRRFGNITYLDAFWNLHYLFDP